MATVADYEGRRAARGIRPMGAFLVFGTSMAFLAGLTLTWPGSVLDRMWALNPRAYLEMAPFGRPAGIAFLILAAILATACIGWWRRSEWGWRMTVVIMATQVVGDLVNLFRGRLLEGVTGVVIASAVLFYLMRRRTRAAFGD